MHIRIYIVCVYVFKFSIIERHNNVKSTHMKKFKCDFNAYVVEFMYIYEGFILLRVPVDMFHRFILR